MPQENDTDNESDSSTQYSRAGTENSALKNASKKAQSDMGTKDNCGSSTEKVLFPCDFCDLKLATPYNVKRHIRNQQ